MPNSLISVPDEIVLNKIYFVRGVKVLLDADLAELYGVESRGLNQAVQRNPERFPDDFMFQLNEQEWLDLKSQFVISSLTGVWGGSIYRTRSADVVKRIEKSESSTGKYTGDANIYTRQAITFRYC